MLEKWGDRSFVTFHKGRCKVCQLGKNLLVLVEAGGQLAGKEVVEKGPEGSGGHKVEHHPAMDPKSKEDRQHPGLH